MDMVAMFSCALVILAFLSFDVAVSADPPAPSPAPAGASPSPSPLAPESGAPVSSPAIAPIVSSPSPLASSPSPLADLSSAPGSTPTPSPSAVPVPAPASDLSHIDASNEEAKEPSRGGMSGGRKAGIAVGVIMAAGLVGLGGVVYKKRQENIRKSQYGYAARREIL